MTLPVTPTSYQVAAGKRIETVNIHEMGDVVLPGERTLCTITLDCMIPYRGYSYGGGDRDAEEYISDLQRWAKSQQPVRLIISGTDVNLQVLVESVQYGERDGTNDIYATITLREYEQAKAVETLSVASTLRPKVAGRPRAAEGRVVEGQQVKLGPNDTVSSIRRRYYPISVAGVGQVASMIAAKNNIAQMGIKAGATIKLPVISTGGGGR